MAKKSRASQRGKTLRPKGSTAPVAPEDEVYMQQAEAAREKTVQEDANRSWRGQQLYPWSEERARLLDALCAADVPGPDVATCDAVTFYHGMFPRAVKLLYLMHHEPEEFQALRPRLIAIIEKWGVQNVPAASVADKVEAVNFALEVEKAHRSVMPLHRPQRRGPGVDGGN